jgi:hypothetical protein
MSMRLWKNPTLLSRRNLWIFFRYLVLNALIIHVSLGVIAAVRNRLVKSDEYGAVLVSNHAFTDYDYWVAPAAWFGAYPYWTYYFNNRGLKTRWILNAKSADLKRVLQDPKNVSVVLVGHGSLNLWESSDKDVTNDDVAAWMKGLPKKRGEWLQLTCGTVDESPVRIGELAMAKERVFNYDDKVNAYYFVTDALFGFKYLKHLRR